MNGLICEPFWGFFNDYDGLSWKISKGLEQTAKSIAWRQTLIMIKEKISYLFLDEGVKRRTKGLKRLRLICAYGVCEIDTSKCSLDERRATRLVFLFAEKKEIHVQIRKISKACTIKYHTKKHSNLHMVRISHFSLKHFFETTQTSRDFNFAVTTQCNFNTFVVTSFGKQKIKICNLVIFFVGNNWKK